MRILVLTTDAYGCNGGIALYNRDLVDALAAIPKVEEVAVVPRNLHFAPTDIPARVSFHVGGAGGKIAFLRTALAIARNRFDLIICGHINLLLMAAILRLKLRAPLVLLAYGIDVWNHPASQLKRRLLAYVDAVWAISAVTRDRMKGWSGLPKERFALLPNAIHLERYGMAPRRPDLVERYGLAGCKVLLTLGRLSVFERYKGIDEVLEAMPTLLARQPDLVYMIAGDGDDRPRLEAKARDLGVAEQVVFAGFVQESDKADVYRLADIFLMPGHGEGFGFVFLEAMACGIPVIASRLDGSYEAVRGGMLGRTVDPDDRTALVTAIREALVEPRGVPVGLGYFAFPEFQRRLHDALRRVVHTIG